LHSKRNLGHVKYREYLLPRISEYFVFPVGFFDISRVKRQEAGENCIMRNPIILFSTRVL
jgi:hypothetical protein